MRAPKASRGENFLGVKQSFHILVTLFEYLDPAMPAAAHAYALQRANFFFTRVQLSQALGHPFKTAV